MSSFSTTDADSTTLNDQNSISSSKPKSIESPTRFRVGSYSTPPLVTVPALKAHLLVLAVFYQLQQTVESSVGLGNVQDPAARWSVFVNQAVHRFELFLENMGRSALRTKGTVNPKFLPPIDVALVWHTYVLNPRWYQEDGMRNLPLLEGLGGFPLGQYEESIDPFTLQLMATDEQKSEWKRSTSTPYDPIESFTVSKGRTVVDPSTGSNVFVPWTTPDGTGYAQQAFEFITNKGFKMNHEVLGLGKLINDISKSVRSKDFYLASTLFSPVEDSNPKHSQRRAKRIKQVVLKSEILSRNSGRALGEALRWSGKEAHRKIGKRFKVPSSAIMITQAYTRGEPFSLDLTTAILRQGSFVKKMTELGWTLPGRFDGDVTVLQRCVARYHAFLDLISANPTTFMVPTLDIDLAWHTHQLSSWKYKDETIKHVKRFVDHNDKVEETALSKSFDNTAQAWKSRFQVPYSICGCPLPKDSAKSRLAKKLGLSAPEQTGPNHLIGCPENDDEAEASHASEHPSVYIFDHPSSSTGRAERQRINKLRLERDAREAETGSFSPLIRRRQVNHDPAFLYPVPLYNSYGMMGYPGVGACAVVSGGTMNCDGLGANGGGTSSRSGMGGCVVGAGACGGAGGGGAVCGGAGGVGGGCGGGGGGGGCGGGGGGGGGGGCGGSGGGGGP